MGKNASELCRLPGLSGWKHEHALQSNYGAHLTGQKVEDVALTVTWSVNCAYVCALPLDHCDTLSQLWTTMQQWEDALLNKKYLWQCTTSNHKFRASVQKNKDHDLASLKKFHQHRHSSICFTICITIYTGNKKRITCFSSSSMTYSVWRLTAYQSIVPECGHKRGFIWVWE